MKIINWFPIVSVPIGIIVTTIRLILIIFMIIVVHPFMSLLILLIAIIQFSISTIYNEIVLLLIKNIGRSPVG